MRTSIFEVRAMRTYSRVPKRHLLDGRDVKRTKGLGRGRWLHDLGGFSAHTAGRYVLPGDYVRFVEEDDGLTRIGPVLRVLEATFLGNREYLWSELLIVKEGDLEELVAVKPILH